MAGKKKRNQAGFAADKNAFAGEASAKAGNPERKAGQRKAGANQPRDADFGKDGNHTPGKDGGKWQREQDFQGGMQTRELSHSNGNDIQRKKQGKTSGHDDHKPEQTEYSSFGDEKREDWETSGHDGHKPEQAEYSSYGDEKREDGKTSGHDDHKFEKLETFGNAHRKPGQEEYPSYGGKKQESGETSGHNVHKPDLTETPGTASGKPAQKKTSGHDGHKPGQAGFGEKDSFLNKTGRNAAAKAQPPEKADRKKRRQKKYRRGNDFLDQSEKPDFKEPGGMGQNPFLMEVRDPPAAESREEPENGVQKDFTEETGIFAEEERKSTGGSTADLKDAYSRRDTYRQSAKKSRYRRLQGMERQKKMRGSREYAAQADPMKRGGTDGHDTAGKGGSYGGRAEKTDFEREFDVESPVFAGGAKEKAKDGSKQRKAWKKTEKARKEAEKAAGRTEKARGKIPKKKEYSFERVFDEKTGRTKYVLTAVEREKLFMPDSPVKMIAGKAVRVPASFMHGKVAEAERENSAVEGAHKTEQKAEDVYHFVKRRRRGKAQRRKGKLAGLEKKQFQKEVNFRYRKFLEENPDMQEKTLKKQLQKRLQKRRIKREYAKARRMGQTAKGTGKTAAKGADFTVKAAKKIQQFAARHASVIAVFGALALLLIVVMSSFSSCGAMFSEGMSTIMAGSYQSEPKEIDAADLAFSKLEMELQKEINSIETDYPDYDEYRYNLDPIGHDPFALISYLSAVHTEFKAADVQGEIESLFGETYVLTLNPVEETRTRTVTKTGTRTVTKTGTRIVEDPETGEETEEEYEYEEEEEYEYEEEEEYTVSILEVTLTAKNLGTVTAGHMNGEQKEAYALYNETHGLLQRFYTPLDLYWYNYVGSYYGYRIDPATGAEQLHRGVDIAVPTGTPVLAAMDGTVTAAAYDSHYGNYVAIENTDGYCTKYAHLDTLDVHAGQAVTHGTRIGTTGNTGSSTGSHLHIECLFNGEYYNPLFYFDAGTGTLHGESPAPGSGGGNAVPPDSYDDATVQTLMEEAAKYLGYPYVWGGSSPSTSFDCSGFVCWVFSNSGVHDLPRTTAQGIYDQCTPVPASDAKAGDIIFFTGTYNSAGAVSHVGIYCGNGVMIHAGHPIQYSSTNTPYWQSHFYAFGRIS